MAPTILIRGITKVRAEWLHATLTWMMGEAAVEKTYYRGMRNADVTVMEGVMGLYDGASATDLTGSTAHICKLLDIPVVLVVDARSMARSIAAVVKGVAEFEEG